MENTAKSTAHTERNALRAEAQTTPSARNIERKITTRATTVRRQSVVVEYSEDGWLVLFNDGGVQIFGTAKAAINQISNASRRGNVTATITTIEWRNVPDGFQPPVCTQEQRS